MIRRYALIRGGTVVNVIACEEGQAGEITGYDNVIQTDIAGPWWTWTQGGGFVPGSQPVQTRRERWSKVVFWMRLTGAERRGILAARATDAVVDDMQYIFELLPEIDPDAPQVTTWLGILENKGLLTQARVDEILGN